MASVAAPASKARVIRMVIPPNRLIVMDCGRISAAPAERYRKGPLPGPSGGATASGAQAYGGAARKRLAPSHGFGTPSAFANLKALEEFASPKPAERFTFSPCRALEGRGT